MVTRRSAPSKAPPKKRKGVLSRLDIMSSSRSTFQHTQDPKMCAVLSIMASLPEGLPARTTRQDEFGG